MEATDKFKPGCRVVVVDNVDNKCLNGLEGTIEAVPQLLIARSQEP